MLSTSSPHAGFLDQLWALTGGKLLDLLLSPGSNLSLLSLAGALGVGLTVVALQARRRGSRLAPMALLGQLLPWRRMLSPSGRADLGFLAFNVLVFGILFGWMALSYGQVAAVTAKALASLTGLSPHLRVSHGLAVALATLVLFLAAELGFWVDHYISHRFAVLWAFHKAHHTAEHLSPLTNFRLHPVDGIKFANIMALFTGVAAGGLTWLLGPDAHAATLGDRNVIALVFALTVLHLQHSHVWLATTGLWGRILLSPAHHQIHHSADPQHFNTNFGGFLSIWDWMFGTLRVPARDPEPLRFGVDPIETSQHSLTGALITPFVEAFAGLNPWAPAAGAPGVGESAPAAQAAESI